MTKKSLRRGALAGLVIGASALGGCSAQFGESMFTGEDQGRLLISADAEGMRAYNEGLVGLITEARNDPANKSSYWQNADARTEFKKFKIMSRTSGKAGVK